MKKILNQKTIQLTKTDYKIILFLTFLYAIVSFIHLGSTKNPQTFYKIEKNKDIIIELEKQEKLQKIWFYTGVEAKELEIELSEDGKNYITVSNLKDLYVFSWKELELHYNTKYIKLKAPIDIDIGEIKLWNRQSKPIKVKNITSENKQIKNITDESEKIPKEISMMNSSYFDEVYFAKTTYQYLNKLKAYEWTHPPLGKIIQYIPIKITGIYAPFYYRLMGNIAGILMIPLMYLFAIKITKIRKYGIIAATLMMLDTFHFAQTRMGTTDSFLVLFMMLSAYFMFRYVSEKENKKHLFLSGLFFGCSISVKWTGFYLGLALCITYFYNHFKKKRNWKETIGYGVLFFIVIPSIIYIGCNFLVPNTDIINIKTLKDFVKLQKEMYHYHANLKAEHFFSSKWYTWPISYKPVWYYSYSYNDHTRRCISGIGNIVIWWSGIIAYLYNIYIAIWKKDKNSKWLVLVTICLFLPYIFINRIMFLYHYFPILPFMILQITYMLKKETEKRNIKWLIPTYIILCFLFFVLYYPVVSGARVPENYLKSLQLFSTWYF